VEFLLGRYCASADPDEIEEGLQIVKKQLQGRTVRTGEEELFKARSRDQGSVKIIDIVRARLDTRSDSYAAEVPSLGSMRSPSALRSPLQSRRGRWALSAPLGHTSLDAPSACESSLLSGMTSNRPWAHGSPNRPVGIDRQPAVIRSRARSQCVPSRRTWGINQCRIRNISIQASWILRPVVERSAPACWSWHPLPSMLLHRCRQVLAGDAIAQPPSRKH